MSAADELLRRLDAAVDDTERVAILAGVAPAAYLVIDSLQIAIAYRRLGPEAAKAAWWEWREIAEIFRATQVHCETCTCERPREIHHGHP
jgi:hypothetical protein